MDRAESAKRALGSDAWGSEGNSRSSIGEDGADDVERLAVLFRKESVSAVGASEASEATLSEADGLEGKPINSTSKEPLLDFLN